MSEKKIFKYELPNNLPYNFIPDVKKPHGSLLCFYIDATGSMCIEGNSSGLLYLARYLATMALIENDDGLHLHLSVDIGDLDDAERDGAFQEVTIFNTEFYDKKDPFSLKDK